VPVQALNHPPRLQLLRRIDQAQSVADHRYSSGRLKGAIEYVFCSVGRRLCRQEPQAHRLLLLPRAERSSIGRAALSRQIRKQRTIGCALCFGLQDKASLVPSEPSVLPLQPSVERRLSPSELLTWVSSRQIIREPS
jgi:hypothetical protein